MQFRIFYEFEDIFQHYADTRFTTSGSHFILLVLFVSEDIRRQESETRGRSASEGLFLRHERAGPDSRDLPVAEPRAPDPRVRRKTRRGLLQKYASSYTFHLVEISEEISSLRKFLALFLRCFHNLL